MEFKHGDVVLVDFPFVDRAGSKLRPALVVSSAKYHTERPQDVIVAVMSRQAQKYKGQTDYHLKDWKTAGLLNKSVVRSTLITILKARIDRKVGRLSKRDLQEVSKCFKTSLNL